MTEFNTGTVESGTVGAGTGAASSGGRLISYDERVVPFDLAVVIRLHGGAAYVERSPDSVAHFEGDILAGNVRRFLAGQPLATAFDGHTNCFTETGSGMGRNGTISPPKISIGVGVGGRSSAGRARAVGL